MKILVLTNDLMERTVIQQVLQRNGHEIIMASNSETATYRTGLHEYFSAEGEIWTPDQGLMSPLLYH